MRYIDDDQREWSTRIALMLNILDILGHFFHSDIENPNQISVRNIQFKQPTKRTTQNNILKQNYIFNLPNESQQSLYIFIFSGIRNEMNKNESKNQTIPFIS